MYTIKYDKPDDSTELIPWATVQSHCLPVYNTFKQSDTGCPVSTEGVPPEGTGANPFHNNNNIKSTSKKKQSATKSARKNQYQQQKSSSSTPSLWLRSSQEEDSGTKTTNIYWSSTKNL